MDFMKNALFTILALVSICRLQASGNYNSINQTTPANVYFFRLPNYVGSAAKITILSNDNPIVRLRNSSYFRYEAQPGDYIFSTGTGSTSKIKLTVESGKDYYI